MSDDFVRLEDMTLRSLLGGLKVVDGVVRGPAARVVREQNFEWLETRLFTVQNGYSR